MHITLAEGMPSDRNATFIFSDLTQNPAKPESKENITEISRGNKIEQNLMEKESKLNSTKNQTDKANITPIVSIEANNVNLFIISNPVQDLPFKLESKEDSTEISIGNKTVQTPIENETKFNLTENESQLNLVENVSQQNPIGNESQLNLTEIKTEKVNITPLVFAQLSDVHLSDKSFKDSYFGKETNIDPIAFMNMTVLEIKALKPDFVIITGDLVAASDSQNASTASKDFKAFNNSIQPLLLSRIPVYEVVGNHDVVGVNSKTVKTNETGYGKGMFLQTFGLNNTYYSFDKSGYHFVVLDPNSIDKKWNITGKCLDYFINDTQMAWLSSDLANHGDHNGGAIIFIHEPTRDLKNVEDLRMILRENVARIIFSGHWHENELIDASGVPEQNSGALSAAWWQGPRTDGSAEGYRIVVLNGSQVESFYKAAGASRQINLIEPFDIPVSGGVILKAQIWSNQSIKEVLYRLDNGSYNSMNISKEGIWNKASAGFNSSQLSKGYHIVEIEAMDETGPFSKNVTIKVGGNKTVPIGELITHRDAYMGRHIAISGVVTAVFQGGSLPVIQDSTGGVHLYACDCYKPPKFVKGELWNVTAKFGESSGMIELTLVNASDAYTISSSAVVPVPLSVSASSINDSVVGRLVKISNSRVTSIEKDKSGFTIQQGSGKAIVYSNEANFNVSTIQVGDLVDVTGVSQLYKYHTYEITPRSISDIEIHKIGSQTVQTSRLSVLDI